MNNKGLTLIDTILALFMFGVLALIFTTHHHAINRAALSNKESKEIGLIAKNKMEEIKSGYIYIEGNRYDILSIGNKVVFEEEGYRIEVAIKALDDYENIKHINLEVRGKDKYYNLVRYVKVE